jgi:hypothetical protein
MACAGALRGADPQVRLEGSVSKQGAAASLPAEFGVRWSVRAKQDRLAIRKKIVEINDKVA